MTEQDMQKTFDEQLSAFMEKRNELDAEFRALRTQAKERIAELIAKFNFSAEELFPKAKARRSRSAKASKASE